MQMHTALAFWALAVVLPTCEAALSHRSGTKAHSSKRRTALRQVKLPLSDGVDAALLLQSVHSKFGPGNCMATWRNEDGHCQVETKCKDHDISNYAVKFICIDDGGEKVRHVFAAGSFDADEQFDTLIECKKCLAEKEETIQIIQDLPAGNHSSLQKKTKKEEEEEDPGGAPLAELRDSVKQLETFMWSTSDALQKLNAKVYNVSFLPPKDKKPCVDCKKIGEKAAAKAVKAASSLVHHGSAHHREVGEPLRVDAEAALVKEEHRRQLAEEDGDEPPRKALKVAVSKLAGVASSLASAVRSAEVADDAAPAAQPAKAQMVLRAATEVKQAHSLVVNLPKADRHDDDSEENSDDDEDKEDGISEEDEELADQESEQPSISALQKGGDDSEDDDMTESADEEEAEDTEGGEDASE